MSRHDALRSRIVLDVEGEPALPVDALWNHRELQRVQGVDEPALGAFDLGPKVPVLRGRQIRNHVIEPAGLAEWLRIFGGYHPVADARHAIVFALAISASLSDRRQAERRVAGRRLERSHFARVGQKAELTAA